MLIKPYEEVGFINFNDSLEVLTKKLENYEINVSERKFMGKSKTTIFIPSLDLIIILKKDKKTIDTIESFKENLTFKNIDLMKNSGDFLLEYFKKFDSNLIIESDGFRSDKSGIGIYWESEEENLKRKPDSVIVYSKGHYDEEIDPNEILNYYLKKK